MRQIKTAILTSLPLIHNPIWGQILPVFIKMSETTNMLEK